MLSGESLQLTSGRLKASRKVLSWNPISPSSNAHEHLHVIIWRRRLMDPEGDYLAINKELIPQPSFSWNVRDHRSQQMDMPESQENLKTFEVVAANYVR